MIRPLETKKIESSHFFTRGEAVVAVALAFTTFVGFPLANINLQQHFQQSSKAPEAIVIETPYLHLTP